MAYYPVEQCPPAGTVIWCKFPLVNGSLRPGPDIRPSLVFKAIEKIDSQTQKNYAELHVFFGGGSFDDRFAGRDLIITHREDYKDLGLFKATRFDLRFSEIEKLPFSDEFFMQQRYKQGSHMIAGYLSGRETDELKACLRARGYPASA